MKLLIIFIFCYVNMFVFPCRIDNQIQGSFKRKSSRLIVSDAQGRSSFLYEDFQITPTSMTDYGDCYLKFGSSYIFGLKRMGKSICYRCMTPIVLSANVVHLAHRNDDSCFDDSIEAKRSCFDPNAVKLTDGELIFRTDIEQKTVCSPIIGNFEIAYRMNDAALSCERGNGTKANTCGDPSILAISFRNCSFPDFDMNLSCIGTWTDHLNQTYIIVKNVENDDYRCGLITSDNGIHKIFFSNDSSCASVSSKNSFDTYYLYPEANSKPFIPCSFPEWLRGSYDAMTVAAQELFYTDIEDIPTVSYCVQSFDDRVLVFSETKCGDPLGYHCLMFNPRSRNVIDLRTTLQPSPFSNSSICFNETQWEGSEWVTSVVEYTDKHPCGVQGSFRTLKNVKSEFYYHVDFDCDDFSKMVLQVSTSFEEPPFETQTYTCLASWHYNEKLIIYTESSSGLHECFITKIVDNKRLLMFSSGEQCNRDFEFKNNSNIIMADEISKCERRAFGTTKSRKPVNREKIDVEQATKSTALEDDDEMSAFSDEFWFNATPSECIILANFIFILILEIFDQ